MSLWYLSIYLSLDLSSRGAAPQVGRGVAVGLLPTPATPGRGGRRFSLRMNLPQNHGGWIGMNTQWWLGWIELSYVFFFFMVIGIFLCDELGCYCGILGINWDVHLLGFIGTNTKWWLGYTWGLLGSNSFPPSYFQKKAQKQWWINRAWNHTLGPYNEVV